MGTTPSEIGQQMLGELNRLVELALAIELDITDEAGSLAVAAVSAPTILRVVRDAEALLVAIEERYDILARQQDEADSEPVALSLDDIGALICGQVAALEVRDLAFIARTQLRAVATRLHNAIDGQRLVAMVTGADAALCRLRRVLIPLESALGDYEGVPQPIRRWADLELSLRIRRLYGRLRRDVLAFAEPADHEIAAVLEEFARRLASLRADPIYSSLRVGDRIEFLALGKRFSAWLGSDRSELRQGRRIWSDFNTFVALLNEVNNRQELVEHDLRIVARVYHDLYANVRPPRVIPEQVLEELRALEGRDDALDRLLTASNSRRPEDWQAVLTRLWRNAEIAGPDFGVVNV